MAATPTPLQIAAKIHYFLMRELGQGIDIKRMLDHGSYARDVLLVCEACRGSELAELARQYRSTMAALQAPGHSRKPMDWAADTSGFGVTDVPPADTSVAQAAAPRARAAKPKAQRSWFARLTAR